MGKGLTLGAWVLRSGPKAILLHYNTSIFRSLASGPSVCVEYLSGSYIPDLAMASVPQSRGREPVARAYHAAIGYHRYMAVWGGDSGYGVHIETSVVECFDVLSATWVEARQLSPVAYPGGCSGCLSTPLRPARAAVRRKHTWRSPILLL